MERTRFRKFIASYLRKEGKGVYPTISPFEYGEEISFSSVGKPFLIYNQKSWNLSSGAPMHLESGFIRAPAPDKAELVLTQPTGVVSVEEATVEESAKEIKFHCTKLERTATAKHPWVKEYKRTIRLLDDGKLHYKFEMATENQPLQLHLEATLSKVESS